MGRMQDQIGQISRRLEYKLDILRDCHRLEWICMAYIADEYAKMEIEFKREQLAEKLFSFCMMEREPQTLQEGIRRVKSLAQGILPQVGILTKSQCEARLEPVLQLFGACIKLELCDPTIIQIQAPVNSKGELSL